MQPLAPPLPSARTFGNGRQMTIDSTQTQRRRDGYIFLAGFALCIPAVNCLIGNAGTACVANGPCLIPVAPGLMAPSGVLMIGLALVLRDLVQRRLGVGWAIAAIIAGAALSASLAPPQLVLYQRSLIRTHAPICACRGT